VADLNADLRREVLNAPRPCSYRMWTLDDGGILPGVARILYGDANKWPVIFEANKAILKNPNLGIYLAQVAKNPRGKIPLYVSFLAVTCAK